jgi:hypothetical protein
MLDKLERPVKKDRATGALGRRLPWHLLVVLLSFVIAVSWIYPFFNLKTNPAFNSDSAMVLTAITEHVPLSENLFQWGGTRTGLALGAVGWVYFRTFGALHLTSFLGFADAILFVVGCSVFIQARIGGKSCLVIAPLGLLLVLANFNTPLTSVSFAFTVTDIAHRPEVFCLLVLLSWFLLALGEQKPSAHANWWPCVGLVLFLSMVATWVSDLAVIAGLALVLVAMGRAAILKLRFPWEAPAILLCSVCVLKLVRRLSVYGEATNYLYQLPDREMVRALLGTAVLNLWSTLSPATWCVIALIALFLTIAIVAGGQRRHELIQGRPLWHTINLFSMGVVGLTVPLGSKWVFLNEVHPRYFAPGALLLCIAAAQGGAFLVQHLLGPRPRPFVAGGIVALLFFPLAVTGKGTAQVRRDILMSGTSACYRAGEILAGSGVRGILGTFWESYTYVLARPGFLKAAPTETVSKISVANTLQVLGMSRIAWIDRNPSKLQSVMNLRGVSYRESDNSPPILLPTGAYFKRYAPVGVLQIKFGQPEYRIYLRQGWSRDESDASHSWTWAVGRRATMEVPLRADATYELEIVAAATPRLEGPQEMAIRTDGRLLGRLQFGADGRFFQKLLIPPRKENRGTRQIEFEFAYAVSPPKDAVVSGESRAPTVAFEQANFTEQR